MIPMISEIPICFIHEGSRRQYPMSVDSRLSRWLGLSYVPGIRVGGFRVFHHDFGRARPVLYSALGIGRVSELRLRRF